MNKKIGVFVLAALLVLTLAACKKQSTRLPDEVLEIKEVIGLDDIVAVKGEYFNPLKDVYVVNQRGVNVSSHLHVEGDVHYGKVGTYTLHYSMDYGQDSVDVSRNVEIVEGTITKSANPRNSLTSRTVNLEAGSYKVGSDASIQHPIAPQFIEPYLLDKAVPSNGWWTSLLVQNYGGGNGIYTNPYRSSFSAQGVEITNNYTGFVQYWNPDGFNTMANFALALPDLYVKSSDLNAEYRTQVIDYSDTSVKVAMRNTSSLVDHMVISYTQGSPYIFAELANEKSPFIKLASNGVAGYKFYTVDGSLISGSSYTGSGIIVKLETKHIGYETSRPAQVGNPIYGDRYFLISTPDQTVFTLSSEGHPGGLTNKIGMALSNSNTFSVASLSSLDEGRYYHNHAFNMPLKGDVSYKVDHATSEVVTTYTTGYQSLKEDNEHPLLQWLMPHHYQHITDSTFESYSMNTIRGELKLKASNTFTTSMAFHGVLPAMTKSNAPDFNTSNMVSYLQDLSTRTEMHDMDNFLNDEGPYWNSKAIYPLAQGIIIADQIGNTNLKNTFIEKLRYVITDWLTVDGSADTRYLFYNEAWGSVYYSNNDFNTATELSDHAFTHGYLVYAASVLAMYDQTFVRDYGQSVEHLLRDYMHPVKDDYDFSYLRSFDPWAGHTWAHGFGTFAEGNNIESSSEAINSWVGGYLWALATNDEDLKDAAIYGFVHELNHAKTYMFDYSESIFPDKYSQYASVAGMIWGGKYDYATWFGANPTFIYGIQWLPNGEYLSSYALTAEERDRLTDIYNDYLKAKNNQVDTWFANMWSIQALIDPLAALADFNPSRILNDDYPSDLSQTYYLIHSLYAYGQRSTDYVMQVHPEVASSVYVNEQGKVVAMVWNPSAQSQTITFNRPNGSTVNVTVKAKTFTTVSLSK